MEFQEKSSELKKLQDKNKQLKKQIAEMQTPNYWELQIRQKLGYYREGETVYKLLCK